MTKEYWPRAVMRALLENRPSTFTPMERRAIRLRLARAWHTWPHSQDHFDKTINRAWKKAVKLINDRDKKVDSFSSSSSSSSRP